MASYNSDSRQLLARIQGIRFILPLALALVVVLYQVGVAQALERSYGHLVHYSVEIAFYSLTGPVATWLMLNWVERNLREKARLEETTERLRRERESVVTEERERIARDLHDSVAQTLYFVALKADQARQQLVGHHAQAAQILQEIGEQTRHVIQEVRLTIFALQPLAWSEDEFLTMLGRYIHEFAEQTGWQVAVNLPAAGQRIPAAVQSTLFRIVNESLVNIAKHAAAAHVSVTLKLLDASMAIEATIEDDGNGFAQTGRNGRGFGLRQMRDRVAAADGLYELTSHPGQGTTVRIVLPLGREEPS